LPAATLSSPVPPKALLSTLRDHGYIETVLLRYSLVNVIART
jgi:hypothetical protein